jgi:hypothetical protein
MSVCGRVGSSLRLRIEAFPFLVSLPRARISLDSQKVSEFQKVAGVVPHETWWIDGEVFVSVVHWW